ncbi:hypothetical protein H5410_021477 [Solanum commersonii]|uniref:Uncharacterized protein n=1 Tax=Solanum commersonii TaxID=4109 RepID=A0A9J5ZF90_SOLCO|nr:hypothetical protein H5410_021477 [Solanum commersonii]
MKEKEKNKKKKKKNTKCCNNWKLIFVLIVVVFFLFLSITKKNTVKDEKILYSYDTCVATCESNVAKYEAYVAAYIIRIDKKNI